MKIIFLDVDGVLNSNSFTERLWYAHNGNKTMNGNRYYLFDYKMKKTMKNNIKHKRFYRWLDKSALIELKRLVHETNAKVVLSSTWRKLYDYKEFEYIINTLFGMNLEIIGSTPCFFYEFGKRGEEIQHWVDNCGFEIERYIILDDDNDMLLEQKDNFFQTSFRYGLTKKIRRRAVKFLNKK